jgi:GNAT superfamily N-acetyltransferase
MYQYETTTLREQQVFFDQYVRTLSGRYDDFLEEHILKSTFYSILIHGIPSGYFAILDGELLTQFYLPKSAFRHGQAVFADILERYKIKEAFVPTCDEAMLAFCMDKQHSITQQAYFFEDSEEEVRPAEYPRERLIPATLSDLKEIRCITGDFTDRHEERIRDGQLFILREEGEFLGMGIIVTNCIMKGCLGTGMFTNPLHRQKGVGRSIILHLKEWCREQEMNPLPGCWYYNHNSKRTLESAGYIAKTRLLRISFEQ